MKEHGFTLIEVLITTAILVVALGGILSLVNHCYGLVETSRNGSKALNIAQRRFEEIRNMAFGQIFNLHNTGFVIQDPDGSNFNGTIFVTSPHAFLRPVTIDISWNQGARQITHTYTTVIADETD